MYSKSLTRLGKQRDSDWNSLVAASGQERISLSSKSISLLPRIFSFFVLPLSGSRSLSLVFLIQPLLQSYQVRRYSFYYETIRLTKLVEILPFPCFSLWWNPVVGFVPHPPFIPTLFIEFSQSPRVKLSSLHGEREKKKKEISCSRHSLFLPSLNFSTPFWPLLQRSTSNNEHIFVFVSFFVFCWDLNKVSLLFR